ncbi:MAG TPA: hypothetical protein VH165_21265 [Kofleriaceae bacterium]|nr:hypothetical protein [Kofleriaceae bacterium]
MADEDRAVMERLAALEAEVKADADAAGARKAAALAKLRDQRVTQAAERDALRARQAELVNKRPGRAKPAAKPSEPDDLNDLDLAPGKKSLTESLTDRIRRKAARAAEPEGLEELDEDNARRADHLENLGGALELASKANRVKQELTRAPKKGEKSWIKSGVASLALGPIGWLYAGSLREAVPATAGWIILAAIASKILPAFLLMPVLMVVLPLSAIAGVVYALQYNRNGSRQRLFDSDKPAPKQLRSD